MQSAQASLMQTPGCLFSLCGPLEPLGAQVSGLCELPTASVSPLASMLLSSPPHGIQPKAVAGIKVGMTVGKLLIRRYEF